MTDKELNIQFKHEIGSYLFIKDKYYLKWLKQQYPGLDLHHLFKTFMGKKKATDYMVYPIPHEQHLGEVHDNIPAAFAKYYKPSMRLLLKYRNHLAENNQTPEERFTHYSTGEFVNLVKEIQRLKNDKN